MRRVQSRKVARNAWSRLCELSTAAHDGRHSSEGGTTAPLRRCWQRSPACFGPIMEVGVQNTSLWIIFVVPLIYKAMRQQVGPTVATEKWSAEH
eukprot:6180647-Pleurochrysis_carterae.AAC.1